MLESLLFCALPYMMTVQDFNEYLECREDNKVIEYVADWMPTVSTYFKEEDVKQALKVIYCESSGRANAVGINKNGTRDIGLWQFNDDTWAWLTPKLKIKNDRTDPDTATAVASWLVYNDGWHHWNASKSCWNN